MSEPREEAWCRWIELNRQQGVLQEAGLGRETREQRLKPEVGCVSDPYEYERVVWFSFSTGKIVDG